ncbi:MAG: HAMP domain-containing protein [Coriobacteriales bacterium]|nr:HAMP domain-containing protein [Coriobacteriales bacterium]
MGRLGSIAGSFRVRLLLGYVVVAAVFALAWTWSLYGPLTQSVIKNQERSLAAVARAGAALVGQPEADPRQVASRLVAETDLRATIVGSDGQVVADSLVDPATMENHAARPEIAAALRGETGTARRRSATRGDEELYVAVPSRLDGSRVAVRVSQPVAVAASVASTSRQIGIALLAVAVLVSTGVALWAARAAARPVEELSDAARRMADGNLGAQIPDVPRDLSTLAEALGDLRRQMKTRIEQLQTEQLTLRTALDGLTDAVFVLDGDAIRFANGAASRLFRVPAGGWRHKHIDRAGLPASVVGEVQRLMARGGGATEIGPDPTGHWMRVAVLPILGSEDTESSLAVIADVTERARVDRMRRDFVANASHELKTPVSAIQLLAESAKTAESDGDFDQALVFTRQIADEAARLKRLVGDLLDLSRLELAPKPGSVTDLRQAIDNAIAGHRGAAERKSLELTADLNAVAGTDVFAAADPTDVAVALDNLLDNGITYTEAGSVTVRLAVVADEVEIAVTDTGIGIPSEDLPRVFERFYRVDRARSRDSGGTGLGLALVRHVVERSGGSVEVESVLDEGSTFTIRLPLAGAASGAR